MNPPNRPHAPRFPSTPLPGLSALLALAALLPQSLSAATAPATSKPLSYNRDIRPILSDACFHCHGPDEKQRKGNLRLDLASEAVKPAKSGAIAIVPGKPADSELLVRVDTSERDEIMPPPKAHKKLSDAQKTLLRQWIEQGAVYEKHWAFVAPANPVPPQVQKTSWVRNPIDQFILNRLEEEKLSPAPEASKATLLRRVSLDLTGLPPTPAEQDAFLADSSANAFEKAVDRLLASPHFGERMAVDWLDAARYADTNGYQVDRNRELWAWRDWVIQAFNRNLPFDQFTLEQIAGDLLPNPTLEQRIATGFHRNHMINEEGGVIAEEFLAEYTADRVETTASVWLAQTFNCARCHDHKYDPISQKDFYALKAFFHNVNEKGVGNYGAPTRVSSPPFLKLPAPTIEARIASLQSEIRSTEAQIAALSKTASDTLDAWTLKIRESSVSWTPLAWNSATAGKAPLPIHGEPHAARLEPTGARGETLKLKLQLPPVPPSALRIEVATEGPAASLSLSSIKAFLSPKTTAPTRTPLPLRGSAEGLSLSAADATKVADAAPKEQVPLAPKPDAPAAAVFELSLPESAQHGGELELEIALRSGATAPTLWRVLATGADRELLVPDSLRSLASKEAAKRTPKETQQLADFQLRQRDDHRQLSSTLAELQKKLKSYEGEVPTTLVMEELPTPRPTFVLMRGAYDKPGEQVTAATPGVLPPMAAEWPKNRLGLARWLVDPANPLPARVTVNRFWQSVFGTGLVASSGDFGAQGELPSHPELLDWLAQEFIRSGWDVKALLRLLVTSATYRQSSALSPILLERDPANRLLARGPRFRLQSEWVRDQALHAAGLLVDKIGGPSVKPYHPPGIYEQVTGGGYDRYVQDTGESLYRRSLYTYWKRSVPHPAMLVFDAPFRETCTVKRTRTNTPLQALNLMNDPTYVEAARGIAERMMQEALPQPEARLSHGFKLLLCRQPTPAELAILQKALLRHRADFEADPASAKAFVSIGSHKAPENLPVHELAAYTAVACSVLHSDEWINKE